MSKGKCTPASVLALRDQLMAAFESKRDRLHSIADNGPDPTDEKDMALCRMLALLVLADLQLGGDGVEGLFRAASGEH